MVSLLVGQCHVDEQSLGDILVRILKLSAYRHLETRKLLSMILYKRISYAVKWSGVLGGNVAVQRSFVGQKNYVLEVWGRRLPISNNWFACTINYIAC